MKKFEPEAIEAFAFLGERGFDQSAEHSPDLGRRPSSITVRFRSAEAMLETTLAMAFAGEDSVSTTIQTLDGRRQFGPAVAHTGHEMRKALREHAGEARRALER